MNTRVSNLVTGKANAIMYCQHWSHILNVFSISWQNVHLCTSRINLLYRLYVPQAFCVIVSHLGGDAKHSKWS